MHHHDYLCQINLDASVSEVRALHMTDTDRAIWTV